MSRLQHRRARLRAEYGFDFPDDFYRFWDFVNRLSPLDPLHALVETLDVVLVGPFEVLSGRFDGQVPRHSLFLHWRYHDDPPEFFTVLAAGGDDGLHWGWFLDDPTTGSGCVASYYARDAYELSADGDTLFEAMRLHMEYYQTDLEDYREQEGERAEEHDTSLERLDRLRHKLMEYATGDRPETGEEYTECWAGTTRREEQVIAGTLEGMGIVVTPTSYRPLSRDNRDLWRYLRRTSDPADVVEEARQALREGFPATALKLGKDLWATIGGKKAAYAHELLDAAYAGLGRETLRQVLQTHAANRELASVDVLDDEDGDEVS
jgi:hypothetical protein